MPKTIQIDKVELVRLTLYKEADGEFQVYAEYQHKAGTKVVQPNFEVITGRLSAGRKTAALAILDGIAQDIAAQELA